MGFETGPWYGMDIGDTLDDVTEPFGVFLCVFTGLMEQATVLLVRPRKSPS